MKGSGKIIVVSAVVATFLILYVHTQISLFRVSYQIDAKNKVHTRKIEEYRFLKYDVDQLKAPKALEEKMKVMKLDLTLPDDIQVVKVPFYREASLPLGGRQAGVKSFSEQMMGFLGKWIDVAQAKTES
ncbi:MAG: hypothetical protein H6757_06985 [Candidatus Omnitrophica bacterium]|nr:hypothetical protein [Candidatus Omnitrophota bacterium]